jgi:hypothetical protein
MHDASVVHGSREWAQRPLPRRGSVDADTARASELQHAVEANRHLGGPTLVRPRAQLIADHLFPAHGFPLARLWWRLRRRQPAGALVAIHVSEALLLVRSSYRIAWNFPGGGIRRDETAEAAARRELAEEIGLTLEAALPPAGDACGVWDGRQDRVTCPDAPPRFWTVSSCVRSKALRIL